MNLNTPKVYVKDVAYLQRRKGTKKFTEKESGYENKNEK